MQGTAKARRRRPAGGFISLIAGSAIVVGGLLPWIELSTPVVAFQGGRVTGPKTGLDSFVGIVAILAGAVVIGASLLWISRRRAGRGLGRSISFSGIVSGAAGLYFLLTLESHFIAAAVDEAASRELPAAKIEGLLSRLLEAGTLIVRPGLGLMFLLAGSGLAILAGSVGARARAAARAASSC